MIVSNIYLILSSQLQHYLLAHLLLVDLRFELLDQFVLRPQRHLLAVSELCMHLAVHALKHLVARVVWVEADH